MDSFRYDAVFHKKGEMRYISHLDLMTLFRRAIRRAGLPLVMTGGFTPRVKISMPKALKLGRESDNEEMALWLAEQRELAEIMKVVNKELPEGVRLTKILKT